MGTNILGGIGYERRTGGRGHWRRAVVLGVICCGLTAAAVSAGAVDGRDQTIVAELRLTNEQQVALADLGKGRASRDSVRGLAETMSEDHRAAGLDLLAYAGLRGMNLAAVGQPGADRPLHGPLAFDELRATPVARFDYEYVARVVTDQQAAIDESTSARGIAHDPQLVALIDAELVALRAHLDRARAALASIPEPTPAPALPSAATPPL